MVTALSLLEQGFRSLPSPVAFVRAGGFFENFLFGLQAAAVKLAGLYFPKIRKVQRLTAHDCGRLSSLTIHPAICVMESSVHSQPEAYYVHVWIRGPTARK
jgi:hypothetical protein